MNIEDLATKQDIQEIKTLLLQALEKHNDSTAPKMWLRSKEVKALLHISDGTLANMRVKRLLNPAKVEGIYLYRYSEIEALLNNK